MINNRLTWFLEKNKLITNLQTGFRKARSTIDHLICLETLIREAFVKKDHMTAIFFDIGKAYDAMWKYGIIKDLKNMGLKDKLPIFIENSKYGLAQHSQNYKNKKWECHKVASYL